MASQIASVRSRSPAAQASRASTWDCSRAVAFATKRARCACRLDGRRHASLLLEQHGEIALETMRQSELRIGRKRARQMFPRIEAELEKTRKRALHGRARIGGGGRNRQAMKVLHRQPPEPTPSRSPLL